MGQSLCAVLVDPSSRDRRAVWFRSAHHLIIVLGVAGAVLGTLPGLGVGPEGLCSALVVLGIGFFILEYAVRFRAAEGHRLRWALSAPGLMDLAAAFAVPLAIFAGAGIMSARLLAVGWLLKYLRYVVSLQLLARVLRNSRNALLSVALAFLIVLFLAASLAYVLERNVQPAVFSSVPASLWWAMVTITTTGYGDMVPTTTAGRLLGSLVMACGIAVFALWAGILATGFSQEIRRRDFLRAWDLVSAVPFFTGISAGAIAEIAQLLSPRDFYAGQTIMRRGDPGDCMFFIASGEIEVELVPRPLRLGPGSFIGEIALITGAPRSATVTACRACELLALDIADFRRLASRMPEVARAIEDEARRRLSAGGTRS
jgi:voltage-gated potassium channel